jgi:proteasome lid subunit RPN8/RPN11
MAQKVAGHVVTDLLKGAIEDHKRGVALVLWADRRLEDGRERIEGAYAPDTVSTVADLEALARRFDMDATLKAGLAALEKSAASLAGVVPLPVILLVRRPRNIQGTESPIEHVGYLTRIELPAATMRDPEIQPLACYDDLSPRLLRRLSGETKPRAWALLGAGSLGSKIAMHRARSGVAPEFVIDPKWLQAHNAARHALHANPAEDLHLAWLDPKAVALADAISSLAQTTWAIRARHPAILQEMADPKTSKLAWLLNTTASVIVRDWLGGPEGQAAPRGAEAGLFDGGGLGYLAFEGAHRNPDSLDLMGALYALARRRPKVAAAVFKSEGQLGAVRIGEGCASTTMVMSDARLSAMAAPMAELLADADPDAESGMIHLLQRDGIALTHEAIPVGVHLRLPLEGLDGWTVSLSPEVAAAITAEAADFPKSETGGVLLGRVSVIARRIQVVDLVPAPADSKRSATEFVLGIEGLTDRLTAIAEETAAALVCVGTWHSHLGSATPSSRDRASAGIVGTWEARPMVFLIRGTDGWRAVSAASPLVAPPARHRRGGRHGG